MGSINPVLIPTSCCIYLLMDNSECILLSNPRRGFVAGPRRDLV